MIVRLVEEVSRCTACCLFPALIALIIFLGQRCPKSESHKVSELILLFCGRTKGNGAADLQRSPPDHKFPLKLVDDLIRKLPNRL